MVGRFYGLKLKVLFNKSIAYGEQLLNHSFFDIGFIFVRMSSISLPNYVFKDFKS